MSSPHYFRTRFFTSSPGAHGRISGARKRRRQAGGSRRGNGSGGGLFDGRQRASESRLLRRLAHSSSTFDHHEVFDLFCRTPQHSSAQEPGDRTARGPITRPLLLRYSSRRTRPFVGPSSAPLAVGADRAAGRPSGPVSRRRTGVRRRSAAGGATPRAAAVPALRLTARALPPGSRCPPGQRP